MREKSHYGFIRITKISASCSELLVICDVFMRKRLPHLSSFFSFFVPRRYLPVLRGFPAKYIYDPWNAPEEVQKAARCVIGVHYPKPMVNHAEASRFNIERMKQIYQQLSCYRGLGKDTIKLNAD